VSDLSFQLDGTEDASGLTKGLFSPDILKSNCDLSKNFCSSFQPSKDQEDRHVADVLNGTPSHSHHHVRAIKEPHSIISDNFAAKTSYTLTSPFTQVISKPKVPPIHVHFGYNNTSTHPPNTREKVRELDILDSNTRNSICAATCGLKRKFGREMDINTIRYPKKVVLESAAKEGSTTDLAHCKTSKPSVGT